MLRLDCCDHTRRDCAATHPELIRSTTPTHPETRLQYVDYLWWADAASEEILASAAFKANGKALKAAASADTTVVPPELKGRFNAGRTVVPFLHAKSGGVFSGAPITIK
eukprot:3153766-Prymnesium_polylepis.1